MAGRRHIVMLDPGMPVRDAVLAVLADRLGTVQGYLRDVLHTGDPAEETIHQLRVGTRRANAAIRLFQPCLNAEWARQMRRHLRSWRRGAGDAREWDVFARAHQDLPLWHEASTRSSRILLQAWVEGCRRVARLEMVNTLQTDDVAQSSEHTIWQPVLADDTQRLQEPITWLAAAGFHEYRDHVRSCLVKRPKSAEDLHALRIAVKRLRYTIEITYHALPYIIDRDTLYDMLIAVQDRLGLINDAETARTRLRALRKTIKASLPASYRVARMGLDQLIAMYDDQRQQARVDFYEWYPSSGLDQSLASSDAQADQPPTG